MMSCKPPPSLLEAPGGFKTANPLEFPEGASIKSQKNFLYIMKVDRLGKFQDFYELSKGVTDCDGRCSNSCYPIHFIESKTRIYVSGKIAIYYVFKILC